MVPIYLNQFTKKIHYDKEKYTKIKKIIRYALMTSDHHGTSQK